MTSLLLRFANDEAGVTAIEYGLIASLIATVIITAVTSSAQTSAPSSMPSPPH